VRPWILLAAMLVSATARGTPTARFDEPHAQPSRAAPPDSWPRASARALAARAERLVERGETAEAMRLFNDAIRMDPSFAPAYLALGALRQAQRDHAEAERLYTEATRFPEATAEALERRARARRERGRQAEAFDDLRAAIEQDPRAKHRLRLLASWYVERRAWPAALGTWRRLAALLEQEGASEELRQARVQIRALGMLAAELDPVTAAAGHPSWVRRSMTRIAR
jgi:tetratricopeptide (TPR) repeat protein